MSIALPNRATVRVAFPWVVFGLGLVTTAASLAFHEVLFHGFGRVTSADSVASSEPSPTASRTSTVALSEGKFVAAAIETVQADLVSLPSEVGVAGKIEANQDRQVQVRPRAAGVVREVKVTLGAVVKKGQVLAVLDSPDIGTARLNLRAKQRELATVRTEAAWKYKVTNNVASIIAELKKGNKTEDIERAYADRPLGSYRVQILQAFAEFDIAAHEEEKTTELHRKNIVGEHPTHVARHNRESAQAKYEGSIEQSRFDANQQSLVAEQGVRLAEAAVIDAAQRLRILGVTEDIDSLLDKVGSAPADKMADGDVIAYPIVAPFDGTVIARSAVPSQRADPTDILFRLADLSNVWVMADIPESDFGLLPRLQTGTIRLSATAYPGRSFAARLLSVGATVDPATRTVPMIAETNNADGTLKLGMFVRIALDSTAEERVVTVPTSAVVEIDGKSAVFMPGGSDGRTFAFHPVTLGRESGDRRVVLAGLAKGDKVVSKGAFTLKSELILQNETSED